MVACNEVYILIIIKSSTCSIVVRFCFTCKVLAQILVIMIDDASLKLTFSDLPNSVVFSFVFQDQDFSGKVIAPEDENGKIVWACYPLEDVWKV